MASSPVLAQPDPSREYFVDTDASNIGQGAVLVQRDDEGHPHPVAYASRKLTPAEQRYSTREQEALAIVFAIKNLSATSEGENLPWQLIIGPSVGSSQHLW